MLKFGIVHLAFGLGGCLGLRRRFGFGLGRRRGEAGREKAEEVSQHMLLSRYIPQLKKKNI